MGADVKLALGVGVTVSPQVTVDTRPVAKAVDTVIVKPVATVTKAVAAPFAPTPKGKKKKWYKPW